MKYIAFLFVIYSTSLFCQSKDSTFYINQWASQARLIQKTDSALYENLFLKSIHCANRNDLKNLEAKLYSEFGDYYFTLKNFNKSFSYYVKAKTYFQNTEDSLALTSTYLKVALSQYHRGNYRLAIKNFLDCISIADKRNLTDVSAQANEYLGVMYNTFQNFAQSEEKFKRSLYLKSKLKDHAGYIDVALKLSEIYSSKAAFDSSYLYCNLAYQVILKHNEKNNLENVLLLKALSETYTSKYNDAKNTMQQLDQLVNAVQKGYGLKIKYDVVKGNYLLMTDNKSEAQKYHSQAIQTSEKLGFIELISFAYRNISLAYFIIKDYKSAYEYERKSSVALSQALTGDQIKNIGNIELVLGKSKSDDEVKLLNTINKLNQLQLSSQIQKSLSLQRENGLMDSLLNYEKDLSEALENTNEVQSQKLQKEKEFQNKQALLLLKEKKLSRYLLMSLLALLLLGGLLFYNFKRETTKNSIIKKQSEDLQNLMKEIHHRVKNNLQVVSSLLNLQSNYIKDSEAIEAVKDSRNRVFSMALVHQQLYQENDLRHVEVQQYIDSLCASLMSSFNVNTDKITVEKNIEKIMLNDEVLMPLGLILNELITNSIKYAFPDGASGTIKINLAIINDQLVLNFKDNGIGFNLMDDNQKKNTFGYKMIMSFLQKLKGKIDVVKDNGTSITIVINKYK